MYQLYYAPDNASLIVRMVLEELEADYTTVLVDRSNKMERSEAYRRLNPNGLIPVCVIDDQPVYETGAILLSLADRHGQLAPKLDDGSRPQFLKWLFYISNSLHTDMRQLFYPQQYSAPDASSLLVHRELALARFCFGLGLLDRHCADQEGVFLMADQLSIVDIYLSSLLRWAQLYPSGERCLPNLRSYPALQNLSEAVAARAGVQRACAKEGISAPFFDQPSYAEPTEGSAT